MRETFQCTCYPCFQICDIIAPNIDNYNWTLWEEWTDCSLTCGGTGIKHRSRKCVSSLNGAFNCPTSSQQENDTCGTANCPGMNHQFKQSNKR